MPAALELLAHAAMTVGVVGGVITLRRLQPDPNPAIEAREAPAEAAARAAALAGDAIPGTAAVSLAPPAPERRHQELPFVGQDRRAQQLQGDSAAWRQSA